MLSSKPLTEGICAILGGLSAFLFGVADGLFYALVAFVILDYITGIISGIINKTLSSKVGLNGILKKLLLFVLVAIANIVDTEVLGDKTGVLRSAVVSFLMANEGLSILENISSAGVLIPESIRRVLKQLKLNDKGKEEGEEGEEVKEVKEREGD